MTPGKDSQLCTKYPKIFRDRHESPQSTAMCWGLDCGDGWYDILDVLCSHIQHHVDQKLRRQASDVKDGKLAPEEALPEENFQVVASQVKEKWGGLRFYVWSADEEVYAMIGVAEGMSYRTCEDCGNKGTHRAEGWHRTTCDPCEGVRQARFEARQKVGK